VSETVAVLGAGRIGRQIALAAALGGCRVLLVDLKDRSVADSERVLTDARVEITRDVTLMVEEGVIAEAEAAPALARIEDRVGLGDLSACAFVQEALPESVDLKRAAFKRLAGRVAADTIVASTSSTISPSHLADAVDGPERFLVAHWLNPAHIIPLVEVVPGAKTSPEAVTDAVAFYTALGKTPQVVRKEIGGFVANRLQAAIFRECVSLGAQGVVTVDELDSIVTHSVGLRWAVDGPFASFHLGGGDDGMRGFIRQFGPGLEARWRSMEGTVSFDEATTKVLLEQSDAAFGGRTRAVHEAARDARQIAILQVLAALEAQR
jgi:ketoreductase RED1